MVRPEAQALCDSLGIPFDFIGDGELIVNQSPHKGVKIVDQSPLLMYTENVISEDSAQPLNIVPNCVDRSIKDAINALSLKGITPVFVGHGAIVEQNPTAGTIIYDDMFPTCTLFCEVSSDSL